MVFILGDRSAQLHKTVIFGTNDEPRGVLHEHRVKGMIYHPFGRDLLKNRINQRGIAHS